MAKRSSAVEIISYGIYNTWDSKSKTLPKIQAFTTTIPAELDIEFGFIVKIQKAKGEQVRFCIYHPDITDEEGVIMPPFEGIEFVSDNDWEFYLGDTIWAPVSNKTGSWRMVLEMKGRVVAEKTFIVYD